MKDIRSDFPFIKNNPNVAYFDNAATTLKPQSVIDEVSYYYENLSANVHRGDFKASLESTARFDAVRELAASFMNVASNEVIFTSGASESLNLMAHMVSSEHLSKGDVVLLNEAEHASNILPWYHMAQQYGFEIEFMPLDPDGKISIQTLKKAIHPKVKVIAIAHISNVLGMSNPIALMSEIAHQHGILMCVDGAQAIGHTAVDLKALDVDFYAFSAHKMLGPSGVGVLYGKIEHLESMTPLKMGGGSNVRFNTCGQITLKKSPHKFESGTPNIEGVLGFGAAIRYLQNLGFDAIEKQSKLLQERLVNGLLRMNHIHVLNPQADVGIVSFNVKGIFAQDVAAYLDRYDISVRAGEHCAKLLNGALQYDKSVRVSVYFYNTIEEVDRLLDVIEKITLEQVLVDFI